MKRCPTCNSLAPDTENFCDLDGETLLDSEDNGEVVEIEARTSNHFVLPIAATSGVIIGVLLVLIYLGLTHEQSPKQVSSAKSTPLIAQQQLPARPSDRSLDPVPSPTVEPSPSPTIEPSPSVQPTPEPVKLSTSPISTTHAEDASGPVTIKLENGMTIEADEAWQTAEGVWYRKGGVISLVDPKEIKAIEKKTVR